MKEMNLVGNKPHDINERSFEFAVEIVKLICRLRNLRYEHASILDQLQKSGTAIGALLEEARAAESKADFLHKSKVALKEARETKYWLRIFLQAIERISDSEKEKILELRKESEELSKIIATIIVNTTKRLNAE